MKKYLDLSLLSLIQQDTRTAYRMQTAAGISHDISLQVLNGWADGNSSGSQSKGPRGRTEFSLTARTKHGQLEAVQPYPAEEEWAFASSFTNGELPYWPDSVLKGHVRPAAEKAGVQKRIGWHTFRHSFGTLLKASGEDVKTVQELMRHASSRVTLDTYTQAKTPAKRTALSRMSGIFVVPAMPA